MLLCITLSVSDFTSSKKLTGKSPTQAFLQTENNVVSPHVQCFEASKIHFGPKIKTMTLLHIVLSTVTLLKCSLITSNQITGQQHLTSPTRHCGLMNAEPEDNIMLNKIIIFVIWLSLLVDVVLQKECCDS